MLQIFENQAIGSFGKPATVRSAVWSILIHASLLLFLLSLGLSPALQTLPDQIHMVRLVAPVPPPPLPPPAPSSAARAHVRPVVRVFQATLAAPRAIPSYTPTIIEAPPEFSLVSGVPGGIPGGVPGGVLGGVLDGVVGSIPVIEPPPAPPPLLKEAPPPPPLPKRIEVSASIQEAKLLVMIRPDYPAAAKIARVQGGVRLRAIVDREGKVTELKLLTGHPLLAPAACAAVEKWRYHPTLLNGEPVEVVAEVIVNFRLM